MSSRGQKISYSIQASQIELTVLFYFILDLEAETVTINGLDRGHVIVINLAVTKDRGPQDHLAVAGGQGLDLEIEEIQDLQLISECWPNTQAPNEGRMTKLRVRI